MSDHAVHRSATRGAMTANGIDARFSFDFGRWSGPGGRGFGVLRVLNEDRIAPGAGFPMHPHADLEILMLPLSGAIAHEDSLGQRCTVGPDEGLHLRAGAGIRHSQFNARDDSIDHHLQLWIEPRSRGAEPRVEWRPFPRAARIGRWQTVASPDGRDGGFAIDQDATVARARLEDDAPLGWGAGAARRLYLHVVSGVVAVGWSESAEMLASGDAWLMNRATQLQVARAAAQPVELLLVDMAP